MRGASLLVIAGVGCAKVPDPPGVISGDEPAIEVETDATGRVTNVIGPSFQLPFAETGIGLPTQLLADGRAMLAGAVCPYEALVGIDLYPLVTAAGGIATERESSVVAELEGPAVARVRLTFYATYECSEGGPQELAGMSTFTLLPNGRIIRRDRVMPSTTEVSSMGRCTSCGGSTLDTAVADIHFSSYWSFASTNVVARDGTSLPNGGGTIDYDDTCAIAQEHIVAVRWHAGFEGEVELNDNAGKTLAYQWVNGGAELIPGEHHAFSELAIGAGEDPAECDALFDTLDDPVLRVDGRALTIEDGIYDAGVYDGAAITLEPSDPIVNGFAIAMTIDVAEYGHLRVTKDGEPTPFTLQLTDAGFVLWLDGSFKSGETITIEPG